MFYHVLNYVNHKCCLLDTQGKKWDLSMKKYILLCLALSASQIATAEVSEFQLENGLNIVVKPDHRAPVVTSQVWYNVGASYEPDGVTGVSHMLEHMMFKGTKNLKPGEISKVIARMGGSENAFTSQDYTAYFQTIHRQHLQQMFVLEAERMQHLRLDDAEFQKERQVVLEERRMRTEDKPTARLYERFSALAYDSNPYRRPIIGWQADIENYELADLQQWYEQHYAPNNATLVVVGDVEPQAVYEMAQLTFGQVPARALPTAKKVAIIEPVGEKRFTMVDERAKVASLLLGFAVPSWSHAEQPEEAYALEMLAYVLDAGSSSRLSKQLIRGTQQLVQAGVSYDLYARLPTQFLLSAVPSEGVSLADAEAAVLALVQALATEPVTEAELTRILAQVEASEVYELDSLFYQGMKLGQAATQSVPYAEVNAYLERLRSVTPEQIQQAAQKWLRSERMTVAYLQPPAPSIVVSEGSGEVTEKTGATQ